MDRERADKWCELGILWLMIGVLTIGPLATGAVHVFDFLVLQVLTIAAVCLWVLRLWLSERPKLLWPPICWAALAFVALAIGRYLTCDIEYVGRLELIRILVYALLFLVVINNLHKQERVQMIALVLIALATVIGLFALYQFATGSNRVWAFVSPYKSRASGTYISPNHLAGFLEMILPLALAFSVAGRLKAAGRILVGYAALVILAAIAVTVSRGGYLATAVACFLFVLLLLTQKPYRIPALVLLALMLVGGLFLLPKATIIRLRFQRMFTNKELSVNTRYEIWEPALKMWKDNPVWGVGPGHFDPLFRAYRPQGVQLQPDWVHNDYLNTLTDWGCVGAAIVFSAWGLLAFGLVKTWRAVRPSAYDLSPVTGSGRFAFTMGAALGLAAILVHSWVDFNMHIPANAILCVSLMALVSAHIRFTSKAHWRSAGLVGKLAISAVLLGAVAYLGMQGAQRGRAALWVQKADREELFSEAQAAALKRAFAIEPGNSETAYRIGEYYRIQSLQGREDYQDQAREGLTWYKRSMTLNPWDGYGFLRYAMCLDWIGRVEDSAPYFVTANVLDPCGYYSVANIGLHYVQLRDYSAAREWFGRSLKLKWEENTIARSYLDICEARLLESATNSGFSLPLPGR